MAAPASTAAASTAVSSLVSMKNKETHVYETKDEPLPTVVNTTKPRVAEHKDDVDTSNIRPQLSFEHFAGKIYSPVGGPEFLDPEVRNKIRQVSSTRSEFNSFPRSEQLFESPFERYNRLKEELAQFQQDLKFLSAKGKEDPSANLAVAVSKEISKLEDELNSTVQNKEFKAFLDPNFRDTTEIEQRNLMDRLTQEIERAAKLTDKPATETEDKKNDGKPGKVTYQLYYNPQKDAGRTLASLVELDKRISILERTLGASNEEKAFGFPDVHSALVHLSKRLEMLDQHKIDTITRQLKAVMGDIETFHAAKESAEQGNAQSEKINKLYDIMTKWDETAQQLPYVINRLQSLKEVHEESAAVVMRLQSVDSEHENVNKLLQHDKQALDRVEKSLSSNLKVFQNNVKSLEARITDLTAKIEKLK